MYDTPQLQERRISVSAFLTVHDREDEYDVFSYVPARRPHVVIPSGTLNEVGLRPCLNSSALITELVLGKQDTRERGRFDLRESLDLESCDSIPVSNIADSIPRSIYTFSQPPSPTFSFASEFTFPNPHMYDDGISKAGYSDFFKQGLLSQVSGFRMHCAILEY